MKTGVENAGKKNLLAGLFILLFTLWQVANPILLRLSRVTFLKMLEAANSDQLMYDKLSGRWEAVGRYWHFVRSLSGSVVFWLLILAVALLAFYFWGTRRALVVSGMTLIISIGAAGISTYLCSRGIEAFSYGDVFDMLREVAVGGVAVTALGYLITKLFRVVRKRKLH